MNEELVKAGYLAYERNAQCLTDGNVSVAVYCVLVGLLFGFFLSLFVDLRGGR
ncbi:hypothetical protein GO003_019005 [Methylicorpusculum oleiharenae]|uniref:hypothetical protein n=1 Tax=Methylicorpusculum oleiharenae TaxID=1338687 RepID=UPI00135C6159|nr:hypothetical protein [Methylicorpusculum oleiharenae]MCD2452477.1 hypothetical protein [Methylicorpusculum oleiharenae]